MLSADFNRRLSQIGWSQAQLARCLGCDPARVWQWANGKQRVPANVETWLRAASDWFAANPPPVAAPLGPGRPPKPHNSSSDDEDAAA